MCSQPEWTPPSETSPSRWRRPRGLLRARSQAASRTSLSKKLPSATASSIRARSCLTIAPAPRLRWPTSELPICPSGRPTSGPWAESWVWGYSSQRRSKTGVSASEIALPGPASASPQPSRMIRASDGTCGVIASARSLDYGREVVRVERGAADEGAVDVGQREQLLGVAGLDRAAIEDPDLIGSGPPHAQDVADEGAGLLRLLCRGGAAGADRPDRLVGDHDAGDLVGLDGTEVGLQLALQHFLGLPSVAGALA